MMFVPGRRVAGYRWSGRLPVEKKQISVLVGIPSCTRVQEVLVGRVPCSAANFVGTPAPPPTANDSVAMEEDVDNYKHLSANGEILPKGTRNNILIPAVLQYSEVTFKAQAVAAMGVTYANERLNGHDVTPQAHKSGNTYSEDELRSFVKELYTTGAFHAVFIFANADQVTHRVTEHIQSLREYLNDMRFMYMADVELREPLKGVTPPLPTNPATQHAQPSPNPCPQTPLPLLTSSARARSRSRLGG